MSSVLAVILLIAFFGLLAVGAIAAFIISVMQQRQYDTTALPDLGLPEEEVVEELLEEDTEVVTESRFEGLDDAFSLEDEESQELMQNIFRAGGDPQAEKSSKSVLGGFVGAFKRTNNNEKKEEGQANADSE